MEQLINDTTSCKKDNFLQSFLKNFSLLFVLRAVSILLLAGIAILGGRYLSVEDFGKYNIINNLSNLLVIPIIFGMNTTLLKILPSASPSEKSTILGTVFISNLALTLLFTLVFLGITPICTAYFHLTFFQWIVVILLVILLNITLLAESILKSREKFFALGLAKILNASLIFVLFATAIFVNKNATLDKLLTYLLLGQALGTVLLVMSIGKIRFSFSMAEAKKMYRFNLVNMLSWFLTTFLINLDIYLLPFFVSEYELGIYSAYELTTKNYFNIFFYDILAAVLIPMLISSSFNPKKVYTKIIKILFLIFPVVTIGTMVVVILNLTLYGSQYALDTYYLILTALGIGGYSLYLLLSAVLIMDGYKGALLSFKVLIRSVPIFFGTILLLTYFFGIGGTMLSFFLDQLFLTLLLIHAVKKHLLGK